MARPSPSLAVAGTRDTYSDPFSKVPRSPARRYWGARGAHNKVKSSEKESRARRDAEHLSL